MLNKTKRPEAQDAGTIILSGFEPDIVLGSVRTVIAEYQSPVTSLPAVAGHQSPVEYTITDTSWRVLKTHPEFNCRRKSCRRIGNTKLSNKLACLTAVRPADLTAEGGRKVVGNK